MIIKELQINSLSQIIKALISAILISISDFFDYLCLFTLFHKK
jgi:hypothetical protein